MSKFKSVMAFYVILLKERETLERAVYLFGINERQLGRLEISKDNGSVQQLNPAPTDHSLALFTRASVKIYKHWKAGNLPDKTEWAS